LKICLLKPSALAADHLVAVVFLCHLAQGGLDDAASQVKHQVQGWTISGCCSRETVAILQLFACEDQSLLVGWNALLVLDFGIDIFDGCHWA
jgi:hypothetical protein